MLRFSICREQKRDEQTRKKSSSDLCLSHLAIRKTLRAFKMLKKSFQLEISAKNLQNSSQCSNSIFEHIFSILLNCERTEMRFEIKTRQRIKQGSGINIQASELLCNIQFFCKQLMKVLRFSIFLYSPNWKRRPIFEDFSAARGMMLSLDFNEIHTQGAAGFYKPSEYKKLCF